MKVVLGILAALLVGVAGVYFLKPDLLSGPRIMLSQLGFLSVPDISTLVPEDDSLVFFLSIRNLEKQNAQKILETAVKLLASVNQSEKLKNETKEKILRIINEPEAFIAKTNKLDAPSVTDTFGQFKNNLNNAESYLGKEFNLYFGAQIKNQIEIKGIPSPDVLNSVPIFMILQAPLDLPFKTIITAPDLFKDALIAKMSELNIGPDEKNKEKIQKFVEVLQKTTFERDWVSMVPAMKISSLDAPNVYLHLTAIDPNTLVVSTNRDLLGQILNRSVQSLQSDSQGELIQEAKSKNLFISFNIQKTLDAMGGTAAMAKMFIGDLARLDIYSFFNEKIGFGATGRFASEQGAQEGFKKLNGLLSQQKNISDSDLFKPEMKVERELLRLKYETEVDAMIARLNEMQKNEHAAVVKKWQLVAGIEKYISNKKLKLKRFMSLNELPYEGTMNLDGAKPKLLVISGNCPKSGIGVQLESGYINKIAKAKNAKTKSAKLKNDKPAAEKTTLEKLPAQLRVMYSQLPAKQIWDMPVGKSELTAYLFDAKPDSLSLNLHIKQIEAVEPNATLNPSAIVNQFCQLDFTPFVLVESEVRK